jgi:hypothetical protein
MSVALPVAHVVFGSVVPAHEDIVDLRVHLGCTNEISSFECTLQNWDKKYSPGGVTGAWVSPTGHDNPGDKWDFPTFAYDESLGTAALQLNVSSGWDGFLYLTLSNPIVCNKVRFNAKYDESVISQVDVDVLKDDVWVDVYQGPFEDRVWLEKSFASGNVTQMRIRFYHEAEYTDALLYEVDFWEITGGTPIVEGSDATIYGGRYPNYPQLLIGKVEEVDPESRAVEHYIVVRGRCNGEQLFRRHVSKSWDNVKGEAVVKYVIDNYTSLSHVRDETELIEDTDTTYAQLEYEDTPVFDIIKYIAETADKAGVIGFDFRIAPDGKFEFFPKNSKISSVNLSERLEAGSHKRSITRIKNKITIYGAAEASRPPLVDDWTDSLDNWSAEIGTLSLYALNKKYGSYSIRCDSDTDTLRFKRTFGQVKKPQGLSFWIESYDAYSPELSWVRLLAPDDDNYFEFLFSNISDDLTLDFVLTEIALGKNNTYDAEKNPNGIWTKTGNPSWVDIQGIKFQIKRGEYTGVAVIVDGIQFQKTRFEATREDAASQALYGVRERPPEVDEELHSDAECDYRAKALLDFLKSPSILPTVRSTVIDYGTTPILAADKCHIVLPNENVDADYPLRAVDYRFNPAEATLEIELQLEKEPLLLADFIYGFRKSIQKLDKYKVGG